MAWDETMSYLHADGYGSKFNLLISKNESELQETKTDVTANW